MRQIPTNSHSILLCPDTIRIKLLDIHWKIKMCANNNDIKELFQNIDNNSCYILEYFDISDIEILKIDDNIKNLHQQ